MLNVDTTGHQTISHETTNETGQQPGLNLPRSSDKRNNVSRKRLGPVGPSAKRSKKAKPMGAILVPPIPGRKWKYETRDTHPRWTQPTHMNHSHIGGQQGIYWLARNLVKRIYIHDQTVVASPQKATDTAGTLHTLIVPAPRFLKPLLE